MVVLVLVTWCLFWFFQVSASSLWSWVWFAPSAAAATAHTFHAHATNSWTWRWTDKHFPPRPHTAALTGSTTRITDTRPQTISGTPSCSRATGVGIKTHFRSALKGAQDCCVFSTLQCRSRGLSRSPMGKNSLSDFCFYEEILWHF